MSHPTIVVIQAIKITISTVIGLLVLAALGILVWIFVDNPVPNWVSIIRIMALSSFSGIAWYLYQTFFGSD